MLTDAFLVAKRIDYVALEEGSSVNPEFDRTRLKGYDHLKKLGMFSRRVALSWCSFFVRSRPRHTHEENARARAYTRGTTKS